MTKTEKILVVFGLDPDEKPRAARFDVADEKTIRKAAAAQGFKIGRPKTDEATELATRLVDGKIYSPGKGLIPLVSTETYEKLLKLLEIEDPKTDTVTAKASPATANGTNPWAAIAVGSTVLCPTDKGKDRSWWECTVVALTKDSLTVKWTHYPTLKPFKVMRAVVALLPSKR